ncbi:MAG: restriction endonuclease subunit S [Chitinophagaceae bacterium]|nr:restriction endonuclease subunit S [Chitinophagaceae bacterium]
MMQIAMKNKKEANLNLPSNTEIPINWEKVKLKDIGKISSGTTPLRSNSAYHTNGNIPWVKTTDLNNSIITETEEKITEYALKETSLQIYPKGTVLVAMYGGFNQIGRTGLLGIEATINQALSAITVNKDEIDTGYLLYWLNGKVGLWKTLAGSSRKDPNITSKDVGDFPFYKPPLNEQKAIARVLSTADAAIHTTEKLIAQKELRKKWLMQQLLSGKIRLKGYSGEVNLKVVGQFLKEISERNKESKITNVLSVTNSRGFISQSDQFDRSVASEDASNYKIVRKWQFAYNPSRVNVGSLDLLRNFDEGILSPMYVVFSTNVKHLLPDFLYFHLKTQWFYGHIPMFVQGSVRDSLSFDGLCSMKFFIPTIEEQKAIVQMLQAADKEMYLLKSKADKLREKKKGLMQQLLTGKIRVK